MIPINQQYIPHQNSSQQAYYSGTFQNNNNNSYSQDMQKQFQAQAEKVSTDGPSLYNKVASLVSFGQGNQTNNQI